MVNQYDQLAALTEMTARSPVRRFYEEATFFAALGDITGRSVLDVACGTGVYTRRFEERGAARLVGIDSSAGMIEYARHLEATTPRGIDYHVMDAAEIRGLGTFDIVTATYLLHYAPTTSVLKGMCASLHGAVAPGGRLVSICMNPDIELSESAYYRKYGFEVASRGHEGDEVKLTVFLPGEQTMVVTGYRWERATYEAALLGAGFKDIVWHPAQISPEGLAELGADHWADFLRRPHAEVFSCRG